MMGSLKPSDINLNIHKPNKGRAHRFFLFVCLPFTIFSAPLVDFRLTPYFRAIIPYPYPRNFFWVFLEVCGARSSSSLGVGRARGRGRLPLGNP